MGRFDQCVVATGRQKTTQAHLAGAERMMATTDAATDHGGPQLTEARNDDNRPRRRRTEPLRANRITGPASGSNGSANADGEIEWDEVLRHNQPGDFWVVFVDGVYDVSEWMYRHPGGLEILVESYGQDVTKLFNSIGHSDGAWELTKKFKVGRLKPGSTPSAPVEPCAAPHAFAAHGPNVHGPGDTQAGPKLNPIGVAESSDARELPEYDWDEILRHDKVGDYWVVLWDGVYDVSEWIYHHPGGAEVFIEQYGQDASQAFDQAGHSDEAWELAQSFKVGRLLEGARPPAALGSPSITSRGVTQTRAAHHLPESATDDNAGPLEIPWAARWLVPKGERFANFDVINDNDTQLKYQRQFGHIYAVGIPTKKWRLVMVSDPYLLDEVAGNDEQFGKDVRDINFFTQLAGSRGGGISVVGDSDYYDAVRRVMLPWYAPAHQKTQFDRMKDVAKQMMAAWASIADDEPLEMREWMQRYTLEISGRGACNYEFGLLAKDAVKSPFAIAVPDSTKESVNRVAEPYPDFTLLAGKAKRARKRKYRRDNELLFSTAEHIVQGRLHTCPMGTQTDLLTRLMTVADPDTGEYLDPDTIRDQILMHLSNGFNGPSITAAWIALELAQRPDVEDKLIAEIDAITGGDPDYELQYTDLMALPYMTQVIKETLRIYPPMPVTIRRSLKDGLLGRYRVRKDDIILVGALAAQRDPRFWGPTPEMFDPDHFAMDKVVERPRHAFIPFSVGTRQCMAQEVTFMMLRVGLFEIYNRYRLRLVDGARVVKNTSVTTKPVTVPVVRVLREGRPEREDAIARRRLEHRASSDGSIRLADGDAWDRPSEIPDTSPFRHLVIAYGSNFGTNKELAERFAERSRIYGYTHEVVSLNDLVDRPPHLQPWLLVVMTATYTANPPGNAIAFKTWLDRTEAGCDNWRNCRYLVWGLGNSQWNAFLAFPRYVHAKLADLGATPISNLDFGDVGSPIWEDGYHAWNRRIWPTLIELAGARPSEAAAARVAAERAAEQTLTTTDSDTAMALSLDGQIVAPTIMTNAVGITTIEVHATVCRELQALESPSKTRHLEMRLPAGFDYTAGDHLGVCPQNSDESVERLAQALGAALDGVFAVPKHMNVRAVPKVTPLQVRNVLKCLVDITAMPSIPLIDLLLDKAQEPDERAKLAEIRDVLSTLDGVDSPLRTRINSGGYDVVRLLDEFSSCSLNIFEFLQVAQPLRPRYYSTSSSPRVHGTTTAHLSVGRTPVAVPGEPDRQFCGMSSAYVHGLREGDRLNVFLDQAEGFHLQEDHDKPMIFVSAGTGYAPMRAFLWERLGLQRDGVKLGPAVLFNGIRSSQLDYIYRDEIEMFVSEGVLDHLHVAMSREIPGKRDYVQHRIVAQGALVWDLIERGAYIYVCGSQAMRDDVRAAFACVLVEHGSMTAARAETFMATLETQHQRYRPDVWG